MTKLNRDLHLYGGKLLIPVIYLYFDFCKMLIVVTAKNTLNRKAAMEVITRPWMTRKAVMITASIKVSDCF